MKISYFYSAKVTCEYKMDNGRPVPIRVHTIVISTQHSEDITQEEIQVSSPLLLPRQCGHMLPFLLINYIETTFGACDQARGARGVLGRQNRLPLEPLGTYIHTYNTQDQPSDRSYFLGSLRHRRPARRCRFDWAKDHHRHLWRLGSPRRRSLLRKGHHQG